MTTTDHRATARRFYGHAEDVALESDKPLGATQAMHRATYHLLAAIHDELRAIRDHVTEPRWIVPDADSLARPLTEPADDEPEQPLAEWMRVQLLARSPSTETERILATVCDRLREAREERDRARTQVISLTGDLDDWRDRWQSCDRAWAEDRAALRALRDRMPAADEVVVRREDVHYAVTVLDALDPFLDAENERWLTRLRAALGGDDQ